MVNSCIGNKLGQLSSYTRLKRYTASAVIGSLRASSIYILTHFLSDAYQEKGLPLALSLSNVAFAIATTGYLYHLTSADDIYALKKVPSKSEMLEKSKELIKVGGPLFLQQLEPSCIQFLLL